MATRQAAPCESVLSVDIGSSTLKAAVVGSDGTFLGQASLDVSAGQHLRSMGEFKRTLMGVLRDVIEQAQLTERSGAPEVLAVSICTACPVVVAIGPEGELQGPIQGYTDASGQNHLDQVVKAFSYKELGDRTGNTPVMAMHSAGRMAELVSLAGDAGHVRVGHLSSLAVFALTGSWTIDTTQAAYTGLVDVRKPGVWSAELLAAYGLSQDQLPELHRSDTIAATISREASLATGCPRVPVTVGAADSACAAVGIGCIRPGSWFESSGTSGVLTRCLDETPPSPETMNRPHIVPELWLAHAAMSSTGASLDWVSEVLSAESTTDIQALAAASAPGANGVTFLPFLAGERSPWFRTDLRGSWHGISSTTSRSDLARAVIEGIVYGLRFLLVTTADLQSQDPGPLPIVGGGSRSPFLNQLKADILNRDVKPSPVGHVTLLGAMNLATVALGLHRSYPDALEDRIPTYESTYRPSDSSDLLEGYEFGYLAYLRHQSMVVDHAPKGYPHD